MAAARPAPAHRRQQKAERELADLQLVVVTTSASTVAEDRRSHRRNVFDLVEYLVVERVASSN